ncbi:hypothetical protein Poli38472_000529 [Pythium oligandrum]|uniref:CNNM transmembrane domain-containing protein n=1 Tax=Pythium oligandrum TaxID=41045 RepID=A0A8K1CC36_PYTOL|nr:hypothetical protein Poli38472_000529 [Pythium oligandrum]|eukprot:TMW60487.1 hypothetical protein Poli38472_000529 [Pythium oligandrum]
MRIRLHQLVTCTLLTLSFHTTLVVANGRGPSNKHKDPDAETSVGFEIFRYTGIILLICMSAIFSGLTLGLMALDTTGLEVIIGAGEDPDATEEEQHKASLARQILPVRAKGNQLLTTLVLGNIAVNSLLSILMADLTSGLVGFILSTVTIVVCGEIIPQAVFARHALSVGARLIPLVNVILMLFYAFARPVAIVLDYFLGADVGTIFSKRELQKLLEIHVRQQMLKPHEGHIVRGAMNYHQKRVSDIMVPVHKLFSLPISSFYVFWPTIKRIYQSGFSRVPVWDKDPNDITGVFFVKDLVLIDPTEGVPLEDFARVFARAAHRVWSEAKLGEVLKAFKAGNIHMVLVYDVNNTGPGDPFYELQGLVTLEDIVEEILQDKIIDETDSVEAQQERLQCANRMSLDYV